MSAKIEPEPSEAERQAILAALGSVAEGELGAWAEAALVEGVEADERDP